jgi:hypothetical protein
MLAQDLFTEVELTVSPSQTKALANEAARLGYERLVDTAGAVTKRVDPVNRAGISQHGWAEAAALLGPGAVGYLRYQRESESSYSLALLDSTTNRLVIRVLIL